MEVLFMKKSIIYFLLVFSVTSVVAQDGLLDELNSSVSLNNSVSSTFKALKIVNLESTKLAAKKDFYFIISHRFGSLKGGAKEFFGLDQSTIRFSFFYGFTDWLTLGFSRSSFQKTYDVTAKYKLKGQQNNGFPVSIVGFNAVSVNTQQSRANVPLLEYKHRLTYLSQLLISRKFSRSLSLELAPIYFHENYVSNPLQDNNQYAIGGGGRIKISNRVTFNVDYVYHLNRAENSVFKNPLSMGFDIETGGHVFQLIFSNAQPMYDAGFITNASGDWTKGDVFFGFNLSRVF
ncbi:MAG: DUF5777 family beta-barrel protein [Lutibacter sp.]|uniref:DUF5777 family beta-barrel protein n=1 Tax=Lutibacter sp. TaxID=1925666 RepID=UPI00299DA6E8|nr:DUF5777 family beta-barrel protein [Lutibacter sp.]MDX1829406.1 DUF5777 family beta-barrel protein [Lutibacter sp.]